MFGVRELKCYDPMEKLYYSMKHEPICIYCCRNENLVEKKYVTPSVRSAKNNLLYEREFENVIIIINNFFS
jgi:hypothetical protein